jgi:hypothetical protein
MNTSCAASSDSKHPLSLKELGKPLDTLALRGLLAQMIEAEIRAAREERKKDQAY